VDFPDPDVPTITVIEPRTMSIETQSTTVVDPYCFVRAWISIIARAD
jgi:hypothetical protein